MTKGTIALLAPDAAFLGRISREIKEQGGRVIKSKSLHDLLGVLAGDETPQAVLVVDPTDLFDSEQWDEIALTCKGVPAVFFAGTSRFPVTNEAPLASVAKYSHASIKSCVREFVQTVWFKSIQQASSTDRADHQKGGLIAVVAPDHSWLRAVPIEIEERGGRATKCQNSTELLDVFAGDETPQAALVVDPTNCFNSDQLDEIALICGEVPVVFVYGSCSWANEVRVPITTYSYFNMLNCVQELLRTVR